MDGWKAFDLDPVYGIMLITARQLSRSGGTTVETHLCSKKTAPLKEMVES